jgi:hypothetical protein
MSIDKHLHACKVTVLGSSLLRSAALAVAP